MKDKLTDELKELIHQFRTWLSEEAKYAKLTVAEKLTVFMGTILLAVLATALFLIALVIISFCLVSVFEQLVGQTLAYLCVGGIFLILMFVIILLRKPLIYSPIARMVSKLLIEHEPEN